MKKATLSTFAIALLLFSIFSCGQGQSLTSVNQKSVELNNRAAELMAGGKYDEALPLLDSALAISPSYEWALTNKVLSLEYLGRASEVEPIIKTVIRYNKNNVNAWTKLGMYYDYFEDEKKAHKTYRHAIRLMSRQLGKNEGAISYSDRWILHYLYGNQSECDKILDSVKPDNPEYPLIRQLHDEVAKKGKTAFLKRLFFPNSPESQTLQ